MKPSACESSRLGYELWPEVLSRQALRTRHDNTRAKARFIKSDLFRPLTN